MLIGLAVVVLPMLLGGPEDAFTEQVVTGEEESTQTKTFKSKITPIAGETPKLQISENQNTDNQAQQPQVIEVESQENATDKEKPSQVQTAVEVDKSQDDENNNSQDSKKKSETADVVAVLERGWVVQVGTFKNLDNVKKITDKLKSSGFVASTSPVKTDSGEATRVWVGPFAARVEAARTKTRIKQKVGTEGIIVVYP